MIAGVNFLFFIVLNWHNCVWTAWIVQNVRKSQNVFKLNFKFNFSQSADRCCTVRPGGSLSISPPVGMCRSRGLFLGLISVQGVPKIHKNFKISEQGVWNFHILVNLGLQMSFKPSKPLENWDNFGLNFQFLLDMHHWPPLWDENFRTRGGQNWHFSSVFGVGVKIAEPHIPTFYQPSAPPGPIPTPRLLWQR